MQGACKVATLPSSRAAAVVVHAMALHGTSGLCNITGVNGHGAMAIDRSVKNEYTYIEILLDDGPATSPIKREGARGREGRALGRASFVHQVAVRTSASPIQAA